MKPHIFYSQKYSKATAQQFKKYLPRYVHKMCPHCDDWTLIQNTRRLKLVQIVDMSDLRSNHHRGIKALKLVQKHLKQTSGHPDHLLFHLPYLSKYPLILDTPETYRPLIYSGRAIELLIYWPSFQPISIPFNEFLNYFAECIQAFKRLFQRIVRTFERVQHLKLFLGAQFVKLLEWLGDLFGPCFHHFKSLKTFSIQDAQVVLGTFGKLDNQGLQRILSQVTHFKTMSESPINLDGNAGPNTLKNLVDLTFATYSELRNLAYLKDFNNLKRLTLSSTLYYKKVKKSKFFKYFALPKSLEFIKLTIRASEQMIDDDTVMDIFVQQWTGIESLRELRLVTINLSSSFIISCERILKQLSHLETFAYDYQYDGSSTKESLDIEYLWKGLRSSRETLQNVEIKARDIIASDMTDVNFKLPRLRVLHVESLDGNFKGKIYSGWNMLRFLRESLIKNIQVSPVLVTLGQICIEKNTEFIDFIESIENISDYDIDLSLEVIVMKADPETFTTSLYNLLEHNKMHGSLYISLPEEVVYSLKNLKKLEQAALKNTSLRRVKMEMLSEFTYFEVKKPYLVCEGNKYKDLNLS